LPRLLRQQAGGVVEIRDAYGNLTEYHSSTCAHCQKSTEAPSMRELVMKTDVCRNCMKLVCNECGGKPCRPFMKWVEQQEALHESRQRLFCDMGLS